ncbi:MAG: ABC transporter substrate-binding protein [Actinomycetota bacterium]
MERRAANSRLRLLILILAVFALIAAACGDDDDATDEPESPDPTENVDDEPDDEPEPEDSDEPEDDPEPVEDPPEPTADPLTVWVIEDSSEAAGITFPSVRAGIDARVARLNAEGGVGAAGHPIQVEICVTDFDPNAAAQCARDAAADETAIAVAASVTANSDAYLPILEEAGLANVGTTAFAATDATSSVSFPTMGGLIAATGCQATVLRDEAGITNFGVARGDTPGADQVGILLTVLGTPSAAEVVTPVANTDYTAEIGALAADVDGIVLAQDNATAIKTLRAISQLGLDLPISGSAGQNWTPANLEAAGPAAEGMYVALWYAADDSGEPGVEQYLADLEAVDALGQTDDLAKLGWVAFELIDQVVGDADTVDRTLVLDGLTNMTAFDSGGLTPVLDFTTPGGLFGGAAPRFVNETCAYGQIQEGGVVGLTGLISPFTS